tara:strand:- start:168 stop:392 length:225 start_codon:yes stop_codon:yes gene_type:complete
MSTPKEIYDDTLVFITDIVPTSRPLKSHHNLNVPMTQEDIMSMEKRAVVETSKEKTAHKKAAAAPKKAPPKEKK